MSVSLKLIVAMVICSVVPVVLTLVVIAWLHANETKTLVTDHLVSVAALQENRVNDVRRHRLESLSLLSSRTQLRISLDEYSTTRDPAPQEKMNRILDDAMRAVEKFRRLDVVDLKGEVVASTEADRIGTVPFSDEFVEAALRRDSADTIVRDIEGDPILRSAGPLQLDDVPIGAIISDSELTSLSSAICDYSGLGETGETLLGIMTREGPTTVFVPRDNDAVVKSAKSELLAVAFDEDHPHGTIDTVDYRGEPVVAVVRRIEGPDWALVVKMDEHEAYQSISQTRRLMIAVGVVVVLVLGGATLLISRSIAAPIERLASVSREIRDGDFESRSTDDQRSDEIGQLALAFNKMAESLVTTNRELEALVKERTAELEKTNEELARSNGELEQFASIASHDLQTPIRNVATAVGLFRAETETFSLSENAERYMKHLENAAELMREQVDGILAISRVHSRGADTKLRVNTAKLVDQLVKDLDETVREKNATVEVDELPDVLGDETQLRQVFQNLIENSVKYQKPGTQPLVSIAASHKNGKCTFAVTDNGIGIPEKFRERVFEIFKRLQHAKDYKGTGIGLAICRKIVERHDGKIWVEGPAGGETGSVFRFTVPSAPEEEG